jgi:hypothetical protein
MGLGSAPVLCCGGGVLQLPIQSDIRPLSQAAVPLLGARGRASSHPRVGGADARRSRGCPLVRTGLRSQMLSCDGGLRFQMLPGDSLQRENVSSLHVMGRDSRLPS